VNSDYKMLRGGIWASATKAALARDRMVLHFKLDRKLNLPRAAKAKGPASPAQLVTEARQQSTKLGLLPKKTSRFTGVSSRRGRYIAFINSNGATIEAGCWNSEKEAAVARDRAVLHLKLKRKLNFKSSEKLGGASLERLRQEAGRHSREKFYSSLFHGVCWDNLKSGWRASLRIATKEPLRLGLYDNEVDAAVAVDRAMIAHAPDDSRRNFPRRKLTPATVLELQNRGQVQRRKRRVVSEYRGVWWDKTNELWAAEITANRKKIFLGRFESEEEAAREYDRGAERHHGKRARLNF